MGFVPIVAKCSHTRKPVNFPNFRESADLKGFGRIWVFAMLVISYIFMHFALTNHGIEQLKLLSATLNSFNGTNMLLVTFIHTDVLVLELNGLCKIVTTHHLLTDLSERYVRSISLILIFFTYLLMLIGLFVNIILTEKFGNDNVIDILNIISLFAAGICMTTISSQAWIKMLLMIEICRTLNRRTKQLLVKRISKATSLILFDHTKVFEDLGNSARLYMAIVRNYHQVNRYWDPALLFCQILSLANLVIAFYIMVVSLTSTYIDQMYNFQLQVRTHILWLALALAYPAQDHLQHVVRMRIEFEIMSVKSEDKLPFFVKCMCALQDNGPAA